jgi:hypothetical protein
MKHKFVILFLLAGLIGPWAAQAYEAPAAIKISQVQVSGPAGSDDEFIEIHNAGASDASLSGWSIQYKSASSGFPLTAKRNLPDVTIPAGRYYLIARSAYSGSVTPDLVHSSFSLSGAAAGAMVFLSRSNAAIASMEDASIVDSLSYGSAVGDAALPEEGKALVRVSATGVDSEDFAVVDPTPRNLSYDPPVDPGENEQVPEQPGQEEEENDPPAEQEEEQPTYSSAISISEVLPNPAGADGGKEWVELFNSSSSVVNLKDWVLDDDGAEGAPPASSAYTLPDLAINPSQRLAIAIPAGKFTLNNSSADAVRLFWPDKRLLTKQPYVGPAKDSQTWCLLNAAYAWCQPTMNLANAALPAPQEPEEEEEEPEPEPDYSGISIKIIAILPNPVGADQGGETVTLLNSGPAKASLKDWILDDGLVDEPIGSSAYVLADAELDAGEEIELAIPKGRFSLNNSGEDGVRLFSPDRKIKGSVAYSKAEEGVAYGKVSGAWVWMEEAEEGDDAAGGKAASAAAANSATKLPRSGMGTSWIFFVILSAICYITLSLTNYKKSNEQTRTD